VSRRDSAPIRIGLIGIGAIASAVHLRVLRWVPGAAVVAGADPSPEARAHARRIAGIESVADAAELLARDDIAAVVICARSDRHAELAIAAAEAGKHLYLEKPIATCAADARRVVDAVARAEIIGAIGFNHRFHPLHQRARKLLLDGAIGAVHAVQTAFCEPTSVESMPDWKRWRATGGGALLSEQNRRAMAQAGLVVCLEAQPSTIVERLHGATPVSERPLLWGGDPLERVTELKARRQRFYALSDHIVDSEGRPPEQEAELRIGHLIDRRSRGSRRALDQPRSIR